MDRAVTLELATGPVSWGVDFADAPDNPPWSEVLDGIAAAGFTGLELGPLGYLPTDAVALRAELERRELRAVGTFVFDALHDPARLPAIAAVARRAVALVAAVGGRHLIGIDLVSPERDRTAGRRDAAPALSREGRATVRRAIATLDRIASAGGLTFALHPHAGSYVEFADEIAWASEHAALCLDTGHLAYAGLDPVATLERYAERVALLHLKDVSPRVHEWAIAGRSSFWQAVAAGVFCPLGQGSVDVAGVMRAAQRIKQLDWATIEQDRRAGAGDPVADLRASRAALEGAGVA